MAAPPSEGNLAPDPESRPLREIPGLRKRERTWKDEVRERVRERRRFRGAPGELPLFKGIDDEDAAGDDEAGEDAAAAAARDAEVGAREPEAPAFDDDDLPIRPRDTVTRPIEIDPPSAPEPVLVPEARREGAAPAWDLGPPPRAEETVERPAVGTERLYAAAIDVAVLVPIFGVVIYFASRAARVAVPALEPAWPYLGGYLAFLGLVYACYFTGTTGQTPGKMAAGLRVVDAGGQPPGYVRAFARALLGACGVIAAGLGVLPMMFDPARRALHDRLFRTRVVKG
jgi:uncharacterized RDD family membrane protein YckC